MYLYRKTVSKNRSGRSETFPLRNWEHLKIFKCAYLLVNISNGYPYFFLFVCLVLFVCLFFPLAKVHKIINIFFRKKKNLLISTSAIDFSWTIKTQLTYQRPVLLELCRTYIFSSKARRKIKRSVVSGVAKRKELYEGLFTDNVSLWVPGTNTFDWRAVHMGQKKKSEEAL